MFGGRRSPAGTEWNGYQRSLTHRDRGANLSRQCTPPIEHTGGTERGMAGFAGNDQGGASRRLEKIDVELFARLALLQGCLEHLAKKELEARSIQPSMRTARFYRNRHSAALSLGS